MQQNQNNFNLQENQGQKRTLIDFEKNLSDSVANRVNSLVSDGRLVLPQNYVVGNALSNAWLIIQTTKDKNGRPALEVCTKESIVNAMLEMCILGHNPAKKHGYFIVYGDKLTWFPSYFGKSASIKRMKGIENEPIATLIYEGDEVLMSHNELGEEVITEHKTSFLNKSKDIIGVYATCVVREIKRSAVMTMKDVREAWLKNPSNNKRDHPDFTGEFAKRTAINRLVKTILQTSNDDDLLAETMIQNESQHYDFDENDKEYTELNPEATKEIEEKANSGQVIGFDSNVAEEKKVIVEDTSPTPAPNQVNVRPY